MKDTDYAFCVARIRAVENKLLSKQDIVTLLNQKDYFSAVEFLSSKGYSCENNDIDSVIRTEEDKLSAFLKESVPDSKELESLYILNDYFNLKALVKCLIEGKNPIYSFIYPTTVIFDENKSTSPEDLLNTLGEHHRKTALEAYSYAAQSGNGRYCDVIIDKAAIGRLTSLYRNKKSGLCGEIAALLADTANIKTAFRCIATGQNSDFVSDAIGECCNLDRQKLIASTVIGLDELCNYLNTTDYRNCADIYKNKPADFEKWCDEEIYSKISSAIFTCFGFDPVVSYYYRKSLEIKTVRMILTAVKADADRQIIKERLRNVYA